MKIPHCCCLVVYASVLTSTAGFRPALMTNTRTQTAVQSHDKKNNDWIAPAATTFVAGLTLASQVAFGSMIAPSQVQPQQEVVLTGQQPTLLTAISVPSFGGKSFETLDFSMPSYDEGAKSSSEASPKAPAFNPFGDFEPGFLKQDEGAKEEAASSEQAAAKEQAKADARAAKEAEKAAAEQAKAEAKAAKEAEKAAKRQAELEKQRAATERMKKEEAAAPAPEAPPAAIEAPEFKAPELPKLDIPSFEAPKLDMPKVDLPKMELPKVSLPSFGGGGGEALKFETPEMPKFEAPDMPKFEAPKVELPKLELPKVSLPSFGGGGGGGGTPSEEDLLLEPQDVRDGRAREARQVYLQADAEARDAEAAARAVRQIANDKKKLANAAKDEACKTRPGGKWICLRNPFTAGF